MTNNSHFAIVLAAGKGTRMNSEQKTLNKVAFPILGKPVINYVLDALKPLKLDNNIVVTGFGKEKTEDIIPSYVKVVRQESALGTGDAVKMAKELLKGKKGTTIVLYGDTPLITSSTLKAIIEKHEKEFNSLTILSSIFENPVGYNRIIREEKSERVLEINEVKETERNEYDYFEIDGGVYVFDNELLFDFIDKLTPDKDHGEFSIISLAKMFVEKGHQVGTYIIENQQEIFSINDRFQLSYASKVIRKRVNHNLMLSGVSIEDPDTTYISPDVIIGKDTIIHPNTTISGRSSIGKLNEIGPNTFLDNVEIEDNNVIYYSYIEKSTVGTNNVIGPFVKLKTGTIVSDNNIIEK